MPQRVPQPACGWALRALTQNGAAARGPSALDPPPGPRHEPYTSSADVWSFGVMLAEVVTRQRPYAHTFMTPVQVPTDCPRSPAVDWVHAIASRPDGASPAAGLGRSLYSL